MLIAFRTDASAQTGSGHLMRCMALADALRVRGARNMFLCRHLSQALADRIERQGHQVVRLQRPAVPLELQPAPTHAAWLGTNWRDDAEETSDLLNAPGVAPDWLVVDHYALDARWEQRVRAGACQVLVIDDLADREHACDLLLDQNLHDAPASRYRDKTGPACRLLLGPRFALLRNEFAVGRAARAAGATEGGRVLVFMGGVDAGNFTRTVLRGALALEWPGLALDVVIAAANPHRAALQAEFGVQSNVAFHVEVQDMAQRLAQADIAIGAGGGAMLERACVGVPSLTVAIAANQEPGAASLGMRGATLYLGRATDVGADAIGHALGTLLQSAALRHAMAANAAAVLDGRGADRVARRMLGGMPQLRSAGAADCDAIFEWRNDPATRRHSGDGRPIAREDHARWFAGALANPARRILIAELAGTPIGVLRYDIACDNAEVSIYLVPGNHGRGLGEAILAAGERWLSRTYPEVREIKAVVRRDNLPSLRAFESAGFEDHSVWLCKKVNANA